MLSSKTDVHQKNSVVILDPYLIPLALYRSTNYIILPWIQAIPHTVIPSDVKVQAKNDGSSVQNGTMRICIMNALLFVHIPFHSLCRAPGGSEGRSSRRGRSHGE